MYSVSNIKNDFLSYLTDNNVLGPISGTSVTHFKGLAGSSRVLFLEHLIKNFGNGLVVLPEDSAAEMLAEEAMSCLGEDQVAYFPASEDRQMPISLNPRQAGMRMEVLRDLLGGKPALIILSGAALFQAFPSPERLRDSRLELKPGSRIRLSGLLKILIDLGYVREPMVERPGEISLRGGILDIFPYTGEPPHRLEFFGDEIESIRIFDIETQRSQQQAGNLILVASPDTWDTTEHLITEYYRTLPWIFIEDWELIRARENRPEETLVQRLPVNRIEEALAGLTVIHHHTLSAPEGSRILDIHPVPALGRSPADIRRQIKTWIANHHTVVLLCDPPRQTERMADFLDLEENPLPGFHVSAGTLRHGFRLPSLSLTVITQSDLLGRYHVRRPRKRFKAAGKPIREMSALNPGDIVVHIDYGIGLFRGLEKITVAGSERECIAIRYREDDMLYVPVDKMERVQKYSGREGIVPELTKLGSPLWDKIKSRTKKSVEKIAKELILLYSARQTSPGYAFGPDTTWQNQLETAFVYDETPDQFRAIRDVKEDMEKPVPMDRLICGDVGYGKTEVAVRAAFKAVNDGKQVAVLVPTTVLAQQHFQTFQDRLAPFPVEIEMLSRFRSRKEQDFIVQRMKTGKVDIVIGTHRLFSKDIGFRDLGLLIIDEEQKFGVRHKERLKALRETVDVLALSATPIPRTLNLSLVGIRDMSLIHTPPRDRLPIHTEVLPFDESVVAEAIRSELARQGQIFFVHNRIQSIHAVSRMLEKLVPGIRLAVAHGQMNEHALEKVMVEFTEQKYDCLVATMIVGSGLDMPNVNTLLVNRADRLGLSQLYQLRGRVGRSNQKAYAFLFTPSLDRLKPDAIKRLRTIEEFTELGAGFQIAMRDLEIRGSGNLLGYQQSGNIDAVGFELYTRLVAEAVEELKSGESGAAGPAEPVKTTCQAQIDSDAYFPQEYIDDDSIRVNLYKRLSAFTTEDALENFVTELRDRFGDLPESAQTLISLYQLQILGSQKQIQQIRIENHKLRLFFDPSLSDSFDTPEALSQFLHRITELSSVPVRYLTRHGLGIELVPPPPDPLLFTKKWLQSWG